MTGPEDIAGLQAAIYSVLDELEKMLDDHAVARQMVEHDSEQRKMLLGKMVTVLLEQDKMALGVAEHRARSGEGYGDCMAAYAKAYIAAQKIINRHWFLTSKLDALRGILATQRVLIKDI